MCNVSNLLLKAETQVSLTILPVHVEAAKMRNEERNQYESYQMSNRKHFWSPY